MQNNKKTGGLGLGIGLVIGGSIGLGIEIGIRLVVGMLLLLRNPPPSHRKKVENYLVRKKTN